jgi:hypothetical protein
MSTSSRPDSYDIEGRGDRVVAIAVGRKSSNTVRL